MAPKRKALDELVADRSFLARRHAERLLEAPLERADLAALQASYAAASDDGVRQALALAFERAAQKSEPDPREQAARAELQAIFDAQPEDVDLAALAEAAARATRAQIARGLHVDDGLSVAAISRHFRDSPYLRNVSPATVRRYLDELGVPRRRGKRTR